VLYQKQTFFEKKAKDKRALIFPCLGLGRSAAGEDEELQEADRRGGGDRRSQPRQVPSGIHQLQHNIKYIKLLVSDLSQLFISRKCSFSHTISEKSGDTGNFFLKSLNILSKMFSRNGKFFKSTTVMIMKSFMHLVEQIFAHYTRRGEKRKNFQECAVRLRLH